MNISMNICLFIIVRKNRKYSSFDVIIILAEEELKMFMSLKKNKISLQTLIHFFLLNFKMLWQKRIIYLASKYILLLILFDCITL